MEIPEWGHDLLCQLDYEFGVDLRRGWTILCDDILPSLLSAWYFIVMVSEQILAWEHALFPDWLVLACGVVLTIGVIAYAISDDHWLDIVYCCKPIRTSARGCARAHCDEEGDIPGVVVQRVLPWLRPADLRALRLTSRALRTHADEYVRHLTHDRGEAARMLQCPRIGMLEPPPVRYCAVHILTNPYAWTWITHLDLSVMRLASFPIELCSLTALRRLDINYNDIPYLPAGIKELRNLRDLYMNSNHMRDFPAGVIELPQLASLDASNNLFSALPDEIGRMTRLENLRLADNRLREVPATIGALTRLTQLTLCKNLLETVPVEIGSLTRLEHLNMSMNFFLAPPFDTRRLHNLREFSYYPRRIFEFE